MPLITAVCFNLQSIMATVTFSETNWFEVKKPAVTST